MRLGLGLERVARGRAVRDDAVGEAFDKTAKLLDLRTFIGSLFIVFGLLVGGRGLLAFQEDIAKGRTANQQVDSDSCAL